MYISIQTKLMNHKIFENACITGNIPIIKEQLALYKNNTTILKSSDDENSIEDNFVNICKAGHIEAFDLFISSGTPGDYDYYLEWACEGGNITIIDKLLKLTDKTTQTFNCGLSGASKGGHMDIIKKMMKLGAGEYQEALRAAISGRHVDVIRIMLCLGAKINEKGVFQDMYDITNNSRFNEVINYVIANGFNNWNDGLECSGINGNVSLALVMIEKGATEFKKCFHAACYHGHTGIARLMILFGVTEYDIGLYRACNSSSDDAVHIAKLMISKGQNVTEKHFIEAMKISKNNLIELLLKEGLSNITLNTLSKYSKKLKDDYTNYTSKATDYNYKRIEILDLFILKKNTNSDCAICMNINEDGIALVPCGHTKFHKACIGMIKDKKCPICRKPIEKVMKIYA